MIILDIDMPKSCMNCQLLGRDSMYCQVYPRKDLNLIKVANGKPEWCPIKCDIEDIKQGIVDTVCEESNEGEPKWCAGLGYSLKIIDKYIRGAE